MSKRQPTIEINDQIIAHDEIVEIVDITYSLSSTDRQKASSARNGIRLVDGSILPLPPQKIDKILDFLYQNEQ